MARDNVSSPCNQPNALLPRGSPCSTKGRWEGGKGAISGLQWNREERLFFFSRNFARGRRSVLGVRGAESNIEHRDRAG